MTKKQKLTTRNGKSGNRRWTMAHKFSDQEGGWPNAILNNNGCYASTAGYARQAENHSQHSL
jgi:hypothetical protein